MSKTVKWILFGLVGVIVLLVAFKMLAGNKETGLKVSTEKVSRRTITETVNASGKVYPEVEVKISPDISGEVVDLYVEEGDSVKKGQVLARIFADIYALQRDEAASRVNQSAASVENSKATLSPFLISKEEITPFMGATNVVLPKFLFAELKPVCAVCTPACKPLIFCFAAL